MVDGQTRQKTNIKYEIENGSTEMSRQIREYIEKCQYFKKSEWDFNDDEMMKKAYCLSHTLLHAANFDPF